MVNINNESMFVSKEEREALFRLKAIKGRFKSLYIRRVRDMVWLCEIKYESFAEIVKPKVCISGIESAMII